MKKTFTKLAGGFMAASMILGTVGVAAPQVFADETPSAAATSALVTQNVARNINISKNTEDSKDHTYKAYEIFDGVYDNGVLKQITWGANIDESKLDATKIATAIGCKEDVIKDKDGNLKAELVADALGLIKTEIATDGNSAVTKDGKDDENNVKVGDADKALAFAKEIEEALVKGTPKESKKNADGSYTIEVNTGYWLVTDTTEGGISDRILILAKDENNNIKPKSSVPSSEKHVSDVNDTTGETSDYKDSADYDIGDTIPYELVASLGDGVANYKNYWMNFVDTISEGLTFNRDSVMIVVDYKGDSSDIVQLTDGYTVSQGESTTIESNGTPAKTLTATKYEIEIEDLFSCTGVDKDKITGKTTVTVYYNATLNDKAQFNEIGNPNEFKLEYNRNPKNDKKGEPENDSDKGETTTDRNVVFTYTLDVDKVDSSSQPLAGAKFRLYKKVDGNATLDETAKTITYKTGEKWTETKDKDGNVTRKVEAITKTVAVEKGSELKKALSDEVKTKTTLDDNTWYVDISKGEVEAKNVDGKYVFDFDGLDDGTYVLIESTVPTGYNPTDAVEFTVTADHQLTNDTPQLIELKTDKQTVVKGDKSKGLETTVVNKKGTELPSTGGIGTTIFYIVGAAAAVTAVVLLTTRRRANKED